MAEGALTRHFGRPLVDLLAVRLSGSWSQFDADRFRAAVEPLDNLGLMKRVDAIADSLGEPLGWRRVARDLAAGCHISYH